MAKKNTVKSKNISVTSGNISAKGVRVNNLKGVDIEIERGKMTVVTGVSGSGKSSLAFDTLYAEGQRRYVESLSSYARQFLGRMPKPEAEWIKGLPPAVAIEQKVTTRNPRSTVGTATEIYDYLRLLYGRVGRTFSPVFGEEVKKHTSEDVVDALFSLEEGTRYAITAPVILPENRKLKSQLEVYSKAGYSRIFRNGEFVDIPDIASENLSDPSGLELVVDRSMVKYDADERSRAAESVETAFFEGAGQLRLWIWKPGERVPVAMDFSRRFEADGITFVEPTEMMFNFNNPYGACPVCEGLGLVEGIDERKVVPDTSLSIYEGAVAPWRGEKLGLWRQELINTAESVGFPIHRPYMELTQEQKDFLWHGGNGFGGIDGFFEMVDANRHKVQYSVIKARYRGRTVCKTCHGSRLRKDTEYVKIGGKTIAQLCAMPIDRLAGFFANLELDGHDRKIATRITTEIKARLEYLMDVGLSYLTLDRRASSLSGGESQRINLATSLGSPLMGSMYILDEPSIGLHPRDTMRLVNVMHKLRDAGNTVIVVEHDEDIMRSADNLVDVGPDAGSLGGEIVLAGAVCDINESTPGHTAEFLTGRDSIPVPASRRKWRDSIIIKGARENNLKNIDVRFPLGVLTAVTGVSGSGKSTLVRSILYPALLAHLDISSSAADSRTTGAFSSLQGDLSRITGVELVDQNPIGRSSRSNPATYIKAYDEIRKLFAEQQMSKQMGFKPGYFSFNAEGGRCEECKGEGTLTIEMQFMADITMVCPECGGKRFKKEVLEVLYREKSIADILEMTVNESIEFFSNAPGASVTEKKIARLLQPLADVGLGYVKLGQSTSTLSGGESQRLKLAGYFASEKLQPTVFILDEPTTGLHAADISRLMKSLNALVDRGHTVIVIEHNLDVIKSADYIIDMGPDGGDAGGQLVACGTPEEVAASKTLTAGYLAAKLKNTN
ncbi:excinuclease ABC subunit A [Muribaculaceae bacterium Isolate-104 (HZI)]|nr:excinuclease ABC subunit A [Muribaculaceae bacterium Isolate-104 (HZI)]